MNFLGININTAHLPELDPDFIPLYQFNQSFLKNAAVPVSIAIERAKGEMSTHHTFIHGTPEMKESDCFYIDRLVKFILWMKGGFRIYVSGSRMIYDYLCSIYCAGGKREFDWDYMANVFEHPFEIKLVEKVPESKDAPQKIGGHFGGCRIGFDAGGSDRKVSAVIDGETVYSEEVVWFPKINSDPDYHYDGIVSALKSAASHMPRVDAVGVSTAGVIINNRVMNASLFLKVPKEQYDRKVKNIYLRAIGDTFGNVPYSVVNDGDVSALAGAITQGKNNMLGIAMGTSEAVGYVDENGCITGWLNELAFCPVDASPNAMQDEWSGDYGAGCKYFSQDSVIKLAPAAGIQLKESFSPAEKLKAIQKLMDADDPGAAAIYRSIGTYLAHTFALYHEFYHFAHVLLLGRVMSGKGGELLLETYRKVIADEYPHLANSIQVVLPDEKFRRIGQSAIAASLPEVREREI